LPLPVAVSGAYAAGQSQNELVSSAKRQDWPADLFARSMLAEVLVPALLKAEPAARQLSPFTAMTRDKPGGN
jgi:hypothetical protein